MSGAIRVPLVSREGVRLRFGQAARGARRGGGGHGRARQGRITLGPRCRGAVDDYRPTTLRWYEITLCAHALWLFAFIHRAESWRSFLLPLAAISSRTDSLPLLRDRLGGVSRQPIRSRSQSCIASASRSFCFSRFPQPTLPRSMSGALKTDRCWSSSTASLIAATSIPFEA